jgi:hypothetical protein
MTTYLGSGDQTRRRRDYTPPWLADLADDVTMEASVMTGIVTRAAAVREILGFARTLYDYQEFVRLGDYGDHGFVEDYVSRVHGEPIGSVVVVRCNDAGQTQHIVINHRPLGAVLLWSRLMGEHFRGTPYARYFHAPNPGRKLADLEEASA